MSSMVRATAARMIGRRSSTTARWLIRHGAPAERKATTQLVTIG